MDNITYNTCPVCKERIPSMTPKNGMCQRCRLDKSSDIKKFSDDNNMDPGEVPEELKGLSEIEEMLIAQVFTVMTVYRLRGGQNGYKGNIINFPQNLQEFTNRLPRHPSSLDVILIRRQSSSDPTSFRDFTVRRSRVASALSWLKQNNRFYNDIIIDNEILNILPENGSIAHLLPQIQDDRTIEERSTGSENGEDAISSTFVPSLPNTQREDIAINDTLDRMQDNNRPILWPEIEDVPINEFQTPGYMVKAFPALYPYGKADLRSNRAREVKPAEYFKHLIWYKDGRFANHARWRYFALNSSMRWRALQEGAIFVKQNLNDNEIDVTDIKEMISNGDKQLQCSRLALA